MKLFSRTVDMHKVFATEIEELLGLGYYSFQIKEMIDEVLEGRKVKKLTAQEEEAIRQALIRQIQLGKKALSTSANQALR